MSKVIEVEGVTVETRTPWYEDENYTMSYEKIDGHVFAHLVVYNATKAVMRDIQQKALDFRVRLYGLGYENVFSYTEDPKLASLMGGDPKVVGDWNGKKVISWDLK